MMNNYVLLAFALCAAHRYSAAADDPGLSPEREPHMIGVASVSKHIFVKRGYVDASTYICAVVQTLDPQVVHKEHLQLLAESLFVLAQEPGLEGVDLIRAVLSPERRGFSLGINMEIRLALNVNMLKGRYLSVTSAKLRELRLPAGMAVVMEPCIMRCMSPTDISGRPDAGPRAVSVDQAAASRLRSKGDLLNKGHIAIDIDVSSWNAKQRALAER